MGSNAGSPVHSLPAPRCTDTDCLARMKPETLEIRWPKILHINPDTGTHPRLPLDRTFTVNGSSGNPVTYRLVGTAQFDSQRSHYTAQLMIDNNTFAYDDMSQGSALVHTGSCELISLPDPRAVLWVYHRTSSADSVRRSRLTVVELLMCRITDYAYIQRSDIYLHRFDVDSRFLPPAIAGCYHCEHASEHGHSGPSTGN